MTSSADRRERAKGRTREDILEAAARAFARHGLESATMQHIASEAGYTAAALYTYFDSKQAILESLMTQERSQLLAVFERSIPEGLTLHQRVEQLMRSFFEITDRRRDLIAVFFSSAAHPEICRDQQGPVGEELFCSMVERWLIIHTTERERAGYTADDLAHALHGVARSFFLRWAAGGFEGALADQTKRVVDLFLYGAQGALE
jgi:AcrR family transcriptional regulator